MRKDENIAIIPARAGSKGIKNKNIFDFCGKPLIAWSIEQAIKAQFVDKVYVSTDGEDIADISQKYGAEVIWRPDILATDTACSEDAILHAIEEVERVCKIENIIFLQATSPVRLSSDIDNAIEVFEREKLDSLFSMTKLDDYCLWKNNNGRMESWSYDYKNRGRRQEREPLYLENGSIYIFKPQIIRTLKNRLGGKIGMYEMPLERSYEIDSIQDIEICSYFMRKIYEEYSV
ncbi:N-acylneuraminate cytidylyltransferase [Lachnospiraceae bacterium]|nr:N-acylneuraminate cytidylyltransferase [Lachnospiraceae bacterium]